METLVISVIVLILSGLGFITYQHPLISRKIIIVLMVGVFAIIIGGVTSLFWENNFYANWDYNLFQYQASYVRVDIYNYDLDSIRQVSKDSSDYIRKLDSINTVLQRNMHVYSIKSQLYLDMLKELRKAADLEKEDIITSLIYSVIGLIALVVLLKLTYIFQKLWENDGKSNNKNLRKRSNISN